MESAASKTTRQSRTLDESGYKFGGDTGENLNSQGKGSSATRSQQTKGQAMRMLSAKALRRLDALSEVSQKLKHLKTQKISWNVDVVENTNYFKHSKTELIDRLNADTCEYCGRTGGFFEVHHVGKLKGLKEGTLEKSMAAMRRKTIVLCQHCHRLSHAGKLPDMRLKRSWSGEPYTSKGVRKVRRGVEGRSL